MFFLVSVSKIPKKECLLHNAQFQKILPLTARVICSIKLNTDVCVVQNAVIS